MRLPAFEDDSVRICSLPWSRIRFAPDLRDFDVLIVNHLEPLPPDLDGSAFRKSLNRAVPLGVLGAAGEIVILGDARGFIRVNEGKMLLLDWIGLDFEWETGTGDTLRLLPHELTVRFHEYLERVKNWSYSQTSVSLSSVARQQWHEALVGPLGADGAVRITPRLVPIATTRFGHGIASAIRLEVVQSSAGMDSIIGMSGWLVLLPSNDQAPDDAVTMLLEQVYGVRLLVSEPAWASALIAPAQPPLDAELASLRKRRDELNSEVSHVEEQRREVRSVLSVLYSIGPQLESGVRALLTALGAQIELPSEPNKEDGWASIATSTGALNAVLEIKGTQGNQFGESGIRQLSDWVTRGIKLKQARYKGIFIGNHAIDRPPNERPDPYSASWRTSAALHEFAAITTAQLLEAHQRILDGVLSRDDFWQSVFATNGVYRLP